jgi:hypothetical protein
VHNVSVQTGLDVGSGGLYYNWPISSQHLHSTNASGAISADLQYRLAFVDPASVATTVVSPSDLDALTSYNPSSAALNDLMKQQVLLTRQFVEIQTRLHRDLISSWNSSTATYHYTTLEDTKEYIRQHRRPVLTFEDAMKQVQLEMGLA